MEPRFDLVIFGDVNPDLVLRGDVEPEFGQAERLVDEAHLTIGGSGAIVACAAARLGLAVAMCGVVGDDLFGRWMRDQVARGVGVDGLGVDPQRPTGLTVVLSKSDDRAILTHPGTISELRAHAIDRALLADARHVHVSSFFLQRGLAQDVPELFDEAHGRGATTSIDPNWDPSEAWNGGLAEALTRTDVFLPNANEARAIARQPTIDEAVQSLAHRSGGLVVAKLGPEGAVAARAELLTRAAGVPTVPVDTTGAGDAFDAGFLASWLAGEPLERSLAIANACGALSTRALGGVDGQPTMDEVRAIV